MENNLKDNIEKLKETFKDYETFETHSLSSFLDSISFDDRFIAFFINKPKNENGYIITVECSEIEKETFQEFTKAEIIVLQKECFSNDQAIQFFDNKLKRLLKEDDKIKKEAEKYSNSISKMVERESEYFSYENDLDDEL